MKMSVYWLAIVSVGVWELYVNTSLFDSHGAVVPNVLIFYTADAQFLICVTSNKSTVTAVG